MKKRVLLLSSLFAVLNCIVLPQAGDYHISLNYLSGSNVISIQIDTVEEISFQNYYGRLIIRNVDSTKSLSLAADSIGSISFSNLPLNMIIRGKYSPEEKSIPLDSILELTLEKVTSIDNDVIKPRAVSGYELCQNYPNPFNPSTNISFSMPEGGNTRLIITNLLGELVSVLADGYLPMGVHSLQFNAANLTSGVYFYTLSVSGADGKPRFRSSKKLTVVK